MKRIITFAFSFFVGIAGVFAQNAEAVFFSELGEKFIVRLNGEQINETPSNRVTAADLTSEFYQLMVDFEDASLQDFTANVGVAFGSQVTYMIKMNNKGKYVARPFSETPLSTATSVETTSPVQTTTPVSEPVERVVVEETIPDEEITITQTTTTTTTSGDKGEKVGVGMTIDGVEMGVTMTIPDMDMEMESTETTTVTTTTTTRTGTTGAVTRPVETEMVETVPAPSGPAGCSAPMTKDEFDGALNSIKSKSFSDTKMTTARQIAKSRCLTASQVAAVMGVMDFEEDRLEFAKFAYDYTFDQNSYYLVNDAFQFESSIEELDEYLLSR